MTTEQVFLTPIPSPDPSLPLSLSLDSTHKPFQRQSSAAQTSNDPHGTGTLSLFYGMKSGRQQRSLVRVNNNIHTWWSSGILTETVTSTFSLSWNISSSNQRRDRISLISKGLDVVNARQRFQVPGLRSPPSLWTCTSIPCNPSAAGPPKHA